MKRKRKWFIFFTLCLALVASLSVAEIGLRLLGKRAGVSLFGVFSFALDGNPHMRSKIPGLFWELAPNVDTVFQEHRVKTNSIGFRDRDFGPKGDKLRIVSLGDSIAFGAAVNQNEPYAKVLEKLLSEMPGRKVEVINAGVSGYNFLQYALNYEKKAKQYDPDLILLGLFSDDFLPPYMPKEHRFQIILLEHSFLYRTLADRFKGLSPIYGTEQSLQIQQSTNRSLAKLKAMKEEAMKEGRSILAIEHPDLQPGDYVDRYFCHHCDWLKQLDIPYIEMFYEYRKTGKPLVSFSIEPQGDPHPNAKGHKLIAKTIQGFLEAHPELLFDHGKKAEKIEK